jgi:enoyl-[acyl-carrier protein] reductase I
MTYHLLEGKRGIIFGALNDLSIAWKMEERAVEEGTTVTLSNTPVAIRMGDVKALAAKLNVAVRMSLPTKTAGLFTVNDDV